MDVALCSAHTPNSADVTTMQILISTVSLGRICRLSRYDSARLETFDRRGATVRVGLLLISNFVINMFLN